MFDFLKKKIDGFVKKVTGRNKEAKREDDAIGDKGDIEKKFQGKKEERKPEHKKIREPRQNPEQNPEQKQNNRQEQTKSNLQKQQLAQPHENKTKDNKTKDRERHFAKLGVKDHIVGLFGGSIELKESHLSEALDDLELGLIESDVSLDISEEIKDELYTKLVGKKVKKSQINNTIQNTIRNAIESRMNDKPEDILTRIKSSNGKPFIILFLGPNGAGKTTTIAKMAKHLIDNNLSVVFASSDTFRAAAIEQLDIHASRLGVRNIKRPYGSDPSAVAYDAIQHAKSKNIDVVLVDTAGRQNTDYNLIQELKKIVRVTNPDFKIYVSESIGGNASVEQIQEFHNEVKLDGIILTKLDLDPKGGVVISLYATTNVPILYLGVGQGYDDLVLFDRAWIIKNMGM